MNNSQIVTCNSEDAHLMSGFNTYFNEVIETYKSEDGINIAKVRLTPNVETFKYHNECHFKGIFNNIKRFVPSLQCLTCKV